MPYGEKSQSPKLAPSIDRIARRTGQSNKLFSAFYTPAYGNWHPFSVIHAMRYPYASEQIKWQRCQPNQWNGILQFNQATQYCFCVTYCRFTHFVVGSVISASNEIDARAPLWIFNTCLVYINIYTFSDSAWMKLRLCIHSHRDRTHSDVSWYYSSCCCNELLAKREGTYRLWLYSKLFASIHIHFDDEFAHVFFHIFAYRASGNVRVSNTTKIVHWFVANGTLSATSSYRADPYNIFRCITLDISAMHPKLWFYVCAHTMLDSFEHIIFPETLRSSTENHTANADTMPKRATISIT